MKRRSWLVIVIIIFGIAVVSVHYYYYSSLTLPSPPTPTQNKDQFGIDKIYPTKEGGREWHINMDDPFADHLFDGTFDRNMTRQDDGSWRVNGSAVRLNVITFTILSE
jgi:hypothetical protein